MLGRIATSDAALKAFCAKWNVLSLALFGSVLREDFTPASDIDVLLTLKDGVVYDLDEWESLAAELTGLLGRPVDIVQPKQLTNPFRRHHILSTARTIYAA